MKYNGGPAFPLPMGTETATGTDGMTLRDFFAGQALAGMCASETDGVSYSSGNVASRAYKIADAMLKERESGD